MMKLTKKLHIITLTLAAVAAMLLPLSAGALSAEAYATESRHASGRWVKIKVTDSGLYAISKSTAQSWGFSDIAKVKVFGYGGAPISTLLDGKQLDDLPQLATLRLSDRIVFYAQGPTTWSSTKNNEMDFVQVQHPYSTAGYYLLTDRDDIEPLEMPKLSTPLASTGEEITSFTERIFHEVETYSPGFTGNYFLGEDFRFSSTQTFKFPMPGHVAGSDVKVLTSFAAKAIGSVASSLTFKCNGAQVEAGSADKIAAISSSDSYTHCKLTNTVKSVAVDGDKLEWTITFSNSGTVLQMARLDYITVNYERSLAITGTDFPFSYNGSSNVMLKLSNASASTVVIDVTNPANPAIAAEGATDGTSLRFTPASGLRDYCAYSGESLPTPTLVGSVANQNLHGTDTPDMIIISPAEYLTQAQRIASLHESIDTMRVLVVEPETIYNEFSSGTPDVMAYRKLAKMFYDRGTDATGHHLQHLLLFGKASYDNRRISQNSQGNNYPILLMWQTQAGDYDNTSNGTDDLIAVLNDGSSESNLADSRFGVHCIGVGRMPVKSVTEAKEVVDKLYSYVTGKDFGPWKNTMIMIADDGDNGVHMRQSDNALENMRQFGGNSYVYNRIYLDAFTQSSDGSGNIYPAAREKMFQLLNDGALVLHYIGHANTVSWTHDGLLTNVDINSMYLKHYPLFYTATCEFTRQDADATSGGEILFLNNRGGAIALISAIRPTYISSNEIFTNSLSRNLFRRDDANHYRRLGDIYRSAKNEAYSYNGAAISSYSDSNKLRYGLVGDPAMRLAYPSYEVRLETINDIPVSETNMPDFKARQTLTLKGSIYDSDGTKATAFNGTITPTLYDAEQSVVTNGNQAVNEKEEIEKYVYQERAIKLAVAKDYVTNGEFTVKINIPSEIAMPDSYDNYAPAMVNFYASTDDGLEANGNNEQFFIYGFDETVDIDSEGPEIKSFVLNGDSFTDGGTVNESPMVIAQVFDKSGINISSNGIGHQMSLLLDGNVLYSDLATYYTPEINTSDTEGSGGSINYPLSGLSDGEHTLRLKVWDTFANSSSSDITFSVATGLTPRLFDVYSTSNPATTEANFYIRHDRPDATVTVRLSVYDLMGHEVWTTTQTGKSDMFCSFPITWDLTDMAGRRVQRGIYLYRAYISTDGKQEASKSRKIAVTAP